MSFYWEKHKKKVIDLRLAWYGDDANSQFWNGYWYETISASFYEKLKNVLLIESDLGKCLAQELNKQDCILEAGCGAGSWVAILENHGFANVTGIDYSEKLISHIHRVASTLNVQYGDALGVATDDASYDAYLSFGVVEHKFEGPELFLEEAYRLLKPGGKAIFTVPAFGPLRRLKAFVNFYRDDVDDVSFFQYAFQRNEFLSILRKHNFQIKTSSYINLDRLWMEEFVIYRMLARYNIIRWLQKKIVGLFSGFDGHMLLVVCIKPSA